MRFFSLKAAVIIWIMYGLIISLIIGYINVYFGLYAGMILSAMSPLPPIIYFLIYVWKWNNGEVKFP